MSNFNHTAKPARSTSVAAGVIALFAIGCGSGGPGGSSSGGSGGGGSLPLDHPHCGTVTDIDGNMYDTVQIGDQCWTRSNLRTSTYRDGTPIPQQLGASFWGDLDGGRRRRPGSI